MMMTKTTTTTTLEFSMVISSLYDLRTSQEIIRFDLILNHSLLLDLERRMASRKKSILDNTSPMIWKSVSGKLM